MSETPQDKAAEAIAAIRGHAQAALDLLYGLPGEVELPDDYEQLIEGRLADLLGLCRQATVANLVALSGASK